MKVSLPEIELVLKAINISFVFELAYFEPLYILCVYKRGEDRSKGFIIQEDNEDQLLPSFLKAYIKYVNK